MLTSRFVRAFGCGIVSIFLCLNNSYGQNSIKTLGEVTVVTNRFEQKQSQMGNVVTVLGDSLLRANAGKSLGDLLNQQVGLTVVASQQPAGTPQLVYMRGARTGYTLILIDGVPMYDPSVIENNFDINFLPLEQIERVEILKGGQSTLYGSDALAGVINIITKKTTNQRLSQSFSGRLGSYGTWQLGTSIEGASSKTQYAFSVNTQRTKGFSSAFDAKNKGNFDNDGLWQATIRASLNHALSDKLSLQLSTIMSKYKSDLDAGGFTDDTDYKATNQTLQLGGGLTYQLENGKIRLNANRNNTLRTYLDDSTFVPATAFSTYVSSSYKSVSDFVELYLSKDLSERLSLIAGVDLRSQNTDQSYVSYSMFGKYEAPALASKDANVQLMAAYGSLLWKNTNGLNLELGGRLNHHSTAGNYFTYTFNPYFLWQNRFKALLNVSSSFKVPSLYQLYSPYGNKALRPETATSIDAGVQWFGQKTQDYVRAVWFDRQAKDVIFFKSLNTDPYGQYINLDQQHDKGLELDAQKTVNKLTLSANYTYLTGQIKTLNAKNKDTTYNNLWRRPKHSFNATIGYQIHPKCSISGVFKSVSERTDVFFNDQTYKVEYVPLKPYTLIDLSLNYSISKDIQLMLDLRNVGNVEYFDVLGFNNRRFNFNVGVVWRN